MSHITFYRVSALSNSDNLKFDVIICSMGVAYQHYNVNMARTILVDPPKKVRSFSATASSFSPFE